MNKRNLTSLAALIAITITYSACDAIGDSIKDYRVHLGLHPFQDFWHLVKYGERISLMLLGMMVYHMAGHWKWWVTGVILIIVFALSAEVIWQPLYEMRELWLGIDQKFNLPELLPHWLSKRLGFHW